MPKAKSNLNTPTPREQMKRMARHWQRRAAEAEREGRTAEAASFKRLATAYRRQSGERR